METIRIGDLNDPRLGVYRNLKDRELAAEGKLFIAEGEHVVVRLLQSTYEADSVLLAERRVEVMQGRVPAGVPAYVVPDAMIHEVVGYRFHSGVIAAGRRQSLGTLDEVMGPLAKEEPAILVVCPETSNTENLGLLIRIAAGFGATAMALGERSCDPFYRQTIRVSMGTVFHLPIVQSRDIVRELGEMKERWGVERVATVLDEDAEPLCGAKRAARMAILFGNEAQGLSEAIVKLCDRKVTIPMKRGTDSLNVAVAAGVVLYHFMG
jgi:tRNA G18 (ribose-2'-O)-methylase SpoU